MMQQILIILMLCLSLINLKATDATTNHTLQEYCTDFAASGVAYCSDVASWEGVLKDLFSPDDTCPQSTRYVDLREGDLEVSASNTDNNCNSTWGRRYDPTTTVNPVLIPGIMPCMRNVSFISKVPVGNPLYNDAQAGALNFTLTLGVAFGDKVYRWNGVYNGQGGTVSGNVVGASACDNFWLFDETPAPSPSGANSNENAVLYYSIGGVAMGILVLLMLFWYRSAKKAKSCNIINATKSTDTIETVTVNPLAV